MKTKQVPEEDVEEMLQGATKQIRFVVNQFFSEYRKLNISKPEEAISGAQIYYHGEQTHNN